MDGIASPTRYKRLGLGLLGGCMVLVSLAVAPGVSGLMGGGLALVMLSVAVIDRHRFVIPDQLSATAFILGLGNAAIAEPTAAAVGFLVALSRGACMAGLFYLIRAAYVRLRRREGLGLGDVKLAGVAGVWLSWPLLPIAVEFAALAALGAYVLQQRSRARHLRAMAKLPFGLFFAPAIWLCWLLEATMLNY